MGKSELTNLQKHQKDQDDKIRSLERQQAQTRLELTRSDKRYRATMELLRFQDEVSRRALGWKMAARKIGSSYKIAHNSYKDTLSKQAASDAQTIQLFFSILTVASAGAFAWIYKSAEIGSGFISRYPQSRLGNNKYGVVRRFEQDVPGAIRGALEDATQAGIGEFFSANLPLAFSPTVTAVGKDPQVFQNELENRIDSLSQRVFLAFEKLKTDLSIAPLAQWDNFDETLQKKVHEEWKKEADQMTDDSKLPSEKVMSDELERGVWAAFVLDQHSYRDFGLVRTADTPDFVGWDVVDRLAELKVIPKLSRSEFDRGDYTTILWHWAKSYKPRPFAKQYEDSLQVGPQRIKVPS